MINTLNTVSVKKYMFHSRIVLLVDFKPRMGFNIVGPCIFLDSYGT